MTRVYTHAHRGIPCLIRNRRTCRAISTVLSRIGHVSAADLARICRRVEKFAPQLRSEVKKGLVGGWEASVPAGGKGHYRCKGVVLLQEGSERAVALVAHELGHVCTREADFEKRDGFDVDWTSEMCADYYAYKWGYSRAIERERRYRRFSHHGPKPGDVFTVSEGEFVHRYRVTKHFDIRFIQKETVSGEVVETATQLATRKREDLRRLLAQQ